MDIFKLKKLRTSETDNINNTTDLGEENKPLMAHCFEQFEDKFIELHDLQQISHDYLDICRGIIQLDGYFFPWNDQSISSQEDFLEKSWPFLKESVDIAHRADPEDPDSNFIYEILKEALNYNENNNSECAPDKNTVIDEKIMLDD